MKTIKILFCAALIFSSCLSVDHEVRKMSSEGLAYSYGVRTVENAFYDFDLFEDGKDIEGFVFTKISDSKWNCAKKTNDYDMTGLFVKQSDNDTLSFSFEGNDKSGEYSVHFYTTDNIIRNHYEYLSGTVRVETFLNNQLIGWGEVVFSKDEYYTITTGTE